MKGGKKLAFRPRPSSYMLWMAALATNWIVTKWAFVSVITLAFKWMIDAPAMNAMWIGIALVTTWPMKARMTRANSWL